MCFFMAKNDDGEMTYLDIEDISAFVDSGVQGQEKYLTVFMKSGHNFCFSKETIQEWAKRVLDEVPSTDLATMFMRILDKISLGLA